jgi:cytidylate kinase
MRTRVVGISHTIGAGGEEIGRAVAEQLGFRFVDEEIITGAAEKAGIEPDAVADAEKRRSFLERFVDTLGMASTAGIAYSIPDPELGRSDDFRGLIRDAVEETAGRGEAVIVSHAASIALAGRDDLLRVFITASPDVRARRLAELAGVGEAEAKKMVKEQDDARAEYLKRFYALGRELPTNYDLVINTDALSQDEAAAILVHAIRE